VAFQGHTTLFSDSGATPKIPPAGSAGAGLALATDILKKTRNPLEVAEYRQERGAEVAGYSHKVSLYFASLRPAALDGEALAARLLDEKLCFARVVQLRDCASGENLWVATGLTRAEDGEVFNGTGQLTRCNVRLCSTCPAHLRARARKRARAAIEKTPISRSSKWRFVTLTAPKSRLPLKTVINIFQDAWRRLRKTDAYEQWAIVSGVKGVEFTVDEGAAAGGGYHVHIHALFYSDWIPRETLRAEWTACVKAAYLAAGEVMPRILTADGLCLCDIRLVRSKVSDDWKGPAAVAMDDAVREVCKYITKCESWRDVPALHLIEILLTKRWPRMFEVLGCARAPRGGATSLDTPAVSVAGSEVGKGDGQVEKLPRARAPDWFDYLLLKTFPAWVAWYTGRNVKRRKHRRQGLMFQYPFARFASLDGLEFNLDAYIASNEYRYWLAVEDRSESLERPATFAQREDGSRIKAAGAFCRRCGEVATVMELERVVDDVYWCHPCLTDYARRAVGGDYVQGA